MTISQYRQNHFDTSGTTPIHTNIDTKELAEQVKRKAAENIDNPVRMKNYLEGYQKLKAITDSPEYKAEKQPFADELKNLSDEERKEKIKSHVFCMLKLLHPDRRKSLEHFLKKENHERYENFVKQLLTILDKLFDGQIP